MILRADGTGTEYVVATGPDRDRPGLTRLHVLIEGDPGRGPGITEDINTRLRLEYGQTAVVRVVLAFRVRNAAHGAQRVPPFDRFLSLKARVLPPEG